MNADSAINQSLHQNIPGWSFVSPLENSTSKIPHSNYHSAQ